jgi:AcrR family transcriptional regulator
MQKRPYRLGRREERVARTRSEVLAAVRHLLVAGTGQLPSVGAVAEKAGVSRLTVYKQFGSKAGLLDAVVAAAAGGGHPSPASSTAPLGTRDELERRFAAACKLWTSDPALFRRLPEVTHRGGEANDDRLLAERLAAADQLRPGCSIKEAEDVIGVLGSFPTFDRLHKDGRRSTTAITQILMRLAAAILA